MVNKQKPDSFAETARKIGVKTPTKAGTNQQSDRFRDTAQQLGCDDDETKFNDRLKMVAAAKAPVKDKDGADEGT